MKQKQVSGDLPIGTRINQLRLARGLTLCQLGELLHVSPQAVHKWERGVNYPDITLLPLLSRVLGIPIADLFGEQEDGKENDPFH